MIRLNTSQHSTSFFAMQTYPTLQTAISHVGRSTTYFVSYPLTFLLFLLSSLSRADSLPIPKTHLFSDNIHPQRHHTGAYLPEIETGTQGHANEPPLLTLVFRWPKPKPQRSRLQTQQIFMPRVGIPAPPWETAGK